MPAGEGALDAFERKDLRYPHLTSPQPLEYTEEVHSISCGYP